MELGLVYRDEVKKTHPRFSDKNGQDRPLKFPSVSPYISLGTKKLGIGGSNPTSMSESERA